jgi:RNA polymerase sigma-70 factor, ECF subfamily
MVGLSPWLGGCTVLHVDDRSLVDAILDGDQDACRLLVEREAATVFRCCFRVLGHIQDAEDVSQETFVIAYRSLRTWRGDGSLRAWLARIAMRQALRTADRGRRPMSLELDDDIKHVEPMTASSGDEPLPSLITSERAAQVRASVAALPEPYRETIALRYFAGLTPEEIALAVGRPVGTVRVHAHRALARLRLTLAEVQRA